MMKRLALLLTFLALAPAARANGIQGNVLKTNGQPVWPCDIDITNRDTGQPVIVSSDSTLPNGHYDLVLPDGRYNLVFKPGIGSHTFQGTLFDQRVEANTITSNITLPIGVYALGRVVDKNAAGVPSTNIRFKDSLGATPNNVQDDGTNADGTFNTLIDPPGTWTVEIIPANGDHKAPVQLQNQNITVDLNLGNVVVQDGFVLTCSVTDPQQFPITGAKVIARTLPTRVKMFTPLNTTSGAGVATIVLPVGTYDVSAEPPLALLTTYATASVYNWAANADATLPNFALPPGHLLSAHVVAAGTANPAVGADIDVDMQTPPTFPRIETPNDITDAAGNFTVTVPSGTEMVTINPPVATKLIPVRLNGVVVGSNNVNLGNVSCPIGHWVDITVVTEGTGVPVPNANIDLINLTTGAKLLTVGDVTAANGFARIVSDNAGYRLRISPPDASHDTAEVIGPFRTLQDTVVTVIMPRKGVLGVGPSVAGGLRLANPWPSPARGTVHFSFSGTGEGELSIVDVLGRRVATPWRGLIGQDGTAAWPARDEGARAVPDGVYFAILCSGGERSVRRLVIAQ